MIFTYYQTNADGPNGGGNWIPELTDFNDPEKLLLAKETLRQLQKAIRKSELAFRVIFVQDSENESLHSLSRNTKNCPLFFSNLSNGYRSLP